MKDHLDLSTPCVDVALKRRPVIPLRWTNKHGFKNHTVARIVLLSYLHLPVDSAEGTTCHACNNEKCINPLHLYLGTQKDNIHDQIECGTWVGHKSYASFWKCTSPKGTVTYRRGLDRASKFSGVPRGSISPAAKAGRKIHGWYFEKLA